MQRLLPGSSQNEFAAEDYPVGHARVFPVVTDDKGMQQLARLFTITCWSSLKLLKHMVDNGRIDSGKVTEVLEYWQEDVDLPAPIEKLRKEYLQLFDMACPI
jgi:hypothetical protein